MFEQKLLKFTKILDRKTEFGWLVGWFMGFNATFNNISVI
jgi:hypothetical protein